MVTVTRHDEQRPTLSATVITLDEEDQIGDCLESLRWADEIVVVDAGSTDRTTAIAWARGARVIVHPWEGFAAQKNFALAETSGAWVLQLDADERVTPALRSEIERVVRDPGALDGYYVPRLTHWAGQPIRHGGWYPDYCPRLFRRHRAQWEGLTHERLVVDGAAGRLENHLLHFPYRDVREHLERMFLRSIDLEVQECVARGMRFGWLPPRALLGEALATWRRGPGGRLGARMVYKEVIRNRFELTWLFPFLPVLRFVDRYLLRKGFLDGAAGFWIAVLSALYEGARCARLWEHRRLHAGGGCPCVPVPMRAAAAATGSAS